MGRGLAVRDLVALGAGQFSWLPGGLPSLVAMEQVSSGYTKRDSAFNQIRHPELKDRVALRAQGGHDDSLRGWEDFLNLRWHLLCIFCACLSEGLIGIFRRLQRGGGAGGGHSKGVGPWLSK